MKLVNPLRKAEEQEKDSTQLAMESAPESGRNLERHLRQKMRIYPRSLQPASSTPDSRTQRTIAIQEAEMEEIIKVEFHERKPITSIRGEEIEPGGRDRRTQKFKSDRKIA
jgi:hypothetical protein